MSINPSSLHSLPVYSLTDWLIKLTELCVCVVYAFVNILVCCLSLPYFLWQLFQWDWSPLIGEVPWLVSCGISASFWIQPTLLLPIPSLPQCWDYWLVLLCLALASVLRIWTQTIILALGLYPLIPLPSLCMMPLTLKPVIISSQKSLQVPANQVPWRIQKKEEN